MSKPTPGSPTILALDPGETTGVAVLSIDADWLNGEGEASWEGLKKATRFTYPAQIGRYAKAWNFDGSKARTATQEEMDEAHLPVLAQPLEGSDPMTDAKFYRIIEGRGRAGGGDITTVTHGELRQVRQIAGLLDIHPLAALVIEGFTLRQMSQDTRLLSPDRLRFAVEAEEVLHGHGRLPFLQQPAYAKSTATDERLKRAHLYYPGMPHATDAMRHAATFARDCRQDAETRRAAFPRHNF